MWVVGLLLVVSVGVKAGAGLGVGFFLFLGLEEEKDQVLEGAGGHTAAAGGTGALTGALTGEKNDVCSRRRARLPSRFNDSLSDADGTVTHNLVICHRFLGLADGCPAPFGLRPMLDDSAFH